MNKELLNSLAPQDLLNSSYYNTDSRTNTSRKYSLLTNDMQRKHILDRVDMNPQSASQ